MVQVFCRQNERAGCDEPRSWDLYCLVVYYVLEFLISRLADRAIFCAFWLLSSAFAHWVFLNGFFATQRIWCGRQGLSRQSCCTTDGLLTASKRLDWFFLIFRCDLSLLWTCLNRSLGLLVIPTHFHCLRKCCLRNYCSMMVLEEVKCFFQIFTFCLFILKQ